MSIPAQATATTSARSTMLHDTTELLGRNLLALLFLVSGLGKIAAWSAATGYLTSVGLPGALLPLVVLAEVGGAIAIIAGWKTRIVATLLAGFTLMTAVMFHYDFGDQMQMTMFLKNVSIAGAFLILAATGAGRYSLDARARMRNS